MRVLLLSICLLLTAPFVKGQSTGGSIGEQKHLLYFRDKSGTPFSVDAPDQFLSQRALDRRSRQNIAVTPRDLPVNPGYVSTLKQQGAKVLYTSRWFNAAVVSCTPEKLAELQALPFVRASQSLNRVAGTVTGRSGVKAADSLEMVAAVPETKEYGLSFHQSNMLGVPALHAAGYQGEGIAIAVFDAGFPGVNTASAFAHLQQNGQIKGTYDFVARKEDVYANSSHGTSVLSTMAAYEPGVLIGTAYKADYYLFRTEDATSEHNIEEVNWLLAAEFADSAGVDVINSSLGYTSFDAPSYSYTYEDLNGNTAIITRAADLAAATGILVVVSAGNEGNKPWRYVSAPADADSVLTVGAVDSLKNHAAFSSYGPTADSRIKPDVVAMGQQTYVLSPSGVLIRANGTSFSGPIIAGMVACMWQANPKLSNMQLLQLMRQMGSNASSPNNAIGYGIPVYNATVTALPQYINEGIAITNPVTDRDILLTLSESWTKETSEVQVFDATGKLLLKQTLPAGSNTHTLNLKPGRLKKGVYLCQVSSGDRIITMRFIKL